MYEFKFAADFAFEPLLLVYCVFENVRILTIGYDAAVTVEFSDSARRSIHLGRLLILGVGGRLAQSISLSERAEYGLERDGSPMAAS